MLSILVWCTAISICVGAAAKWLFDRTASDFRITRHEMALYAAVVALLVTPTVTFAGWRLSVQNKMTYREYWNGWEESVRAIPTMCERDGACQHCYDCDPYQEYVSRTCSRSDGKGGSESYECGSWETRYHSCPYTRTEWSYVVNTTLGPYTIASGRFPENPQRQRWREGQPIPEHVVRQAGTGLPPFWQAARDRILRNDPGPVTKRSEYRNYLLASDQTILKHYSSSVARYSALGLLPPVPHQVRPPYLADKASVVGAALPNAAAWQGAVARLNASLGKELHGDLLLVLVSGGAIGDPDDYIGALKAHWQDAATFGKDAASKNAIIVAIGTVDGRTVAWARATTGMPMGNELMLATLQRQLQGVRLLPESVVGDVRGSIQNRSFAGTVHGQGVIERTVFGLDDPATRFKRMSMSGNDEGRGAGYLYLKGEIAPSSAAKGWIIALNLLLSMGALAAVSIAGEPRHGWGFGQHRGRRAYGRTYW